MKPHNPFDLFILAVFAGAGWTLGASLVTSAAQQVNLWLIGRSARKAGEHALEKLKASVAEMEKAAAETARRSQPPAAAEKPREAYFIMPETVGRS